MGRINKTRKHRQIKKSGGGSFKSPKYVELKNNNNNSVSFEAAGCVFTDGKLILAGYQPRKRNPFISGIGGKKEKEETYMQTAIRETIEELFEIYFEDGKIPIECINKIIESVKPLNIIKNGSYIIVLYTFDELSHILKIIKKYKIDISKMYSKYPENVIDLIFNRKDCCDFDITNFAVSNNNFKKIMSGTAPKAYKNMTLPEISRLCLLPVVKHNPSVPFVDKYFVTDLPLIQATFDR